MAKPKYDEMVKPHLDRIRTWCLNGLLHKDIAEQLGINVSTLYEYKNTYPEFAEALKKGKEDFDDEVVTALYKNTIGGTIVLRKPFKLKVKEYDANGRVVSEREIIEYADEETYIKPDTMAQIYWLNNRRPASWKNRPVDTSNSDDALNKLCAEIRGRDRANKEEEKTDNGEIYTEAGQGT